MKGGKRVGAGRKPAHEPKKRRSVAATDKEWEMLKQLSTEEGLSISEYLLKCGLPD